MTKPQAEAPQPRQAEVHSRPRNGVENRQNAQKKRPLAMRKRPKSREETPKEGGGNATQIALPRCNNMPPRRTKRKCGRHIFDETGATRRRTPGSLEATGKTNAAYGVKRRAQAVRRRHWGHEAQPEAARVVP